MKAEKDVDLLAGEAPFIFGGEIRREAATTKEERDEGAETASVTVDEVIRAPAGLTGLSGSVVTVRLLRPLSPGRYIFFAEPWVVGKGLTVQERGHVESSSRSLERVNEAVQDSYMQLLRNRFEEATLVALGTLGEVRNLVEGAGRPRGVPWAVAPLEIERVLKGPERQHRAMVVGPRYASRHLPIAPPLHPGLRAIFFLTAPPREGIDLLSASERNAAFHIATSRDIQSPDGLAAIERLLGVKRKK